EYLQGRIGHGIGMSLHEPPFLSQDNDQLLEEGMAITIEPGLIFPNWGAIRNSDSVIVRKNGLDVLTGYPKPERTSV
ncbi:MAG: M24 family metallopeptidase, partial [Clostridia bacterium]|nr:M24 family metallopeptidase [Clostridia bacterium]